MQRTTKNEIQMKKKEHKNTVYNSSKVTFSICIFGAEVRLCRFMCFEQCKKQIPLQTHQSLL